MSERRHTVAVVGAGIGGVATAVALERVGCKPIVFEQALKFGRVGAGINLTPNAVRILDHLGAGKALRNTAAVPTFRVSKTWDSGAETSRLPMGNTALERYGSAQLTVHRADLLDALEALLPANAVHFGKRLTGLEQHSNGVQLSFADGTSAAADAVIGCDGIHSPVRTAIFGSEEPVFAGMSAFRAIVPSARVSGYETGAFIKWWGPEAKSQIVTMPIARGDELFIFATVPEDGWRHESWSTPGDVAELRAYYAAFHPDARQTIEAVEATQKTALYSREPLNAWTLGRATLLGDSAHPMMPFMAQGAAMALEDVAVLMRAFETSGDAVEDALVRYERVRRPRASRIQRASGENDWLRTGIDADWVYGYDALTAPLDMLETGR